MARQGILWLICWFCLQPALVPGAAPPQQGPNGNVAELPVVYVPQEFQEVQLSGGAPLQAPSGPDFDYAHTLRALAPALFQLRLLEVPSLTVRRVSRVPTCGARGSASSDQGMSSSQGGPLRHPEAPPSGLFYVVRGSLEVRLPDVVFSYSLDKCDDQVLTTIFQATAPFTADHALDQITTAAYALSFKLESAAPRTRVTVTINIEGDAPDRKAIQTELQRRLEGAIAQSAEFEVATRSDYKVGALITFRKGNSPIPPLELVKLIKGWDTLETEKLYIQVRDEKPYPLQSVVGSRGALPAFYDEVTEAVNRTLSVVVLAEKRGWPELELRGKMEIAALVARARQLVDSCGHETGKCKSAQDALPLLAEAASQAREMGNDADARESLPLQGRAQILTGNYADAIASADEALRLVARDRKAGGMIAPQEEAALLKMRADAYLNLKEYPQAEHDYNESLTILPAQPEVYFGKSLALRYEDQRLKALETLIAGLEVTSADADAGPLHNSAKDLIRALQPEEFAEAEEQVKHSYAATPRVRDEYALLLSRMEGSKLDTNWAPETAEQVREPLQKALDLQPFDPDVLAEIYANLARTHLFDKDNQGIDHFLSLAEQLPSAQVSADNREWIDRIRAQYWMNLNQYSKAYDSAETALKIKPTSDANRAAALALWFQAQDEAKSATTPEQESEAAGLYRKVADIVSPLADQRYPGVDGLLVGANHQLGLDAKSQKQFEEIVRRDSKDDSAITTLMMVCAEYTLDFACAYSAAQKDVVLHDPNGPEAADSYVNVAEAAILASKDDSARDWLNVALQQSRAQPREKSLAHLYHLWLAMRLGQTDQCRTDFESWQAATEEFRRSKADLNWLFQGARKAVQESQLSEKQKSLLTGMMDALERSDQPLPVWSD